MWRWRRRGRGRPPSPRRISAPPAGTISYIPIVNGIPSSKEPIYLSPDEYEAYKLVYHDGLTQEVAASKMGVSRGTLWRLLDNARRKIATALVEWRPIIILLTPKHEET